MPTFKKYFDAVNYLETLSKSRHDQAYMHKHSDNPQQYIDRTREFVKHLGNPHRGFRFIHIAGTAGKGTTTAHLHNILYKAGNRVGSFTSPYATTSIEKIKVNDKLIDPLIFAKLVKRVMPAIKKMEKVYKYGRPSYFEIFFGIALLYFKKMKCDYVILEVGCGGKYDAGNIIAKSISACTNIGLDHTHLLGKTLPKIAKEKAGIIKPNTHFFTTEKRPHILKIFKNICKAKNTKFHGVSPPPVSRRGPGGGRVSNEALATSIAKYLKIDDDIITDAIQETSLSCRFEIIQKNPLVILDGAHNPMKIKNVVHNLKHLTYDTLYTIFASGTTKDASKMIKQLAKISDKLILTIVKGKGKSFYTPSELSQFAKSFKNKSLEKNPKKALTRILRKLNKNDCLLITGSFYLVGELRKNWISEDNILKNRTHV